MALIQADVDDSVKERADSVFARSGLTTPDAVRIMVTQVANEGRSPFDGIFVRAVEPELAEDVRRDMVYAEAVELGIVPEDALDDPADVPLSVLRDLGIDPEEVGQ